MFLGGYLDRWDQLSCLLEIQKNLWPYETSLSPKAGKLFKFDRNGLDIREGTF